MSKQDHLDWAEAFFLLGQSKFRPDLIADGTLERRMWLALFYWAGYED